VYDAGAAKAGAAEGLTYVDATLIQGISLNFLFKDN
jgi:hypothetical protein